MSVRKSSPEKSKLKIADFCINITPPIGHPLAYGINNKVDSPIFIRGVILDDQSKRIVLASAEVISIVGETYEHMKASIAKAAGTRPQNVFLHVVHQHDSVSLSDKLNNPVQKSKGAAPATLAYYQEIIKKLDSALQKAQQKFKIVSHLATAEHRMAGLASNRRLLGADGKVHAMRWSMCTDPKLQAEPTGIIDPILRSVGFVGASKKLLAVLHFYASHPMTAYRRDMVGADVPGVALEYVRKHLPGAPLNIYFTGCGANITFGKYSIKPPEKSLKMLGERLGRGILANCKSLEPKATGQIKLERGQYKIPLAIKKSDATAELKNRADWIKKWEHAYVSRISIGPDVHILSMPAEVVIEYQLYAQSLLPEKFLACAAYGQGIYGYIPTKAMFAEGGYETECGSLTTPEIEENLKKAIADVLKDLR